MKSRVLLALAPWLLLLGCSESVETLCEDAARMTCERCYTCSDDENLSGEAICELAEGTPLDGEQGCVATLAERCEYQASTLEDAKSELETCVDSLDSLQCSDMLAASVQDRSVTTSQCSYFL